MKTLLATASMLALLGAAPALAQDTAPATPPAVQDEAPASPSPTPNITTPSADVDDANDADKSAAMSDGQWRSSRLVGVTVRNGANESIGDINDLIVDNTGKITAVVVGVGGFLGMGEKLVSLSFDQLSISRDSNNMIVVMANATKESLESAPEWKDPTKSTMAR